MFITFAASHGRATIVSLICFLALYSIESKVFADSVQIYPDRQLVWGVAFSLDDRYVIATSQDGAVLMWDLESCGLQSLAVPFPVGENLGARTITGIAVSPTKFEFATAMRDGSVRLWGRLPYHVDSKDIEEKAVYSGPPSNKGMRSVAFSPDGTLLAAAGHDPAIYVWRTDGAGAPLHILRGHTAQINTVAFGRDNSTLISAGLDETVRFWDVDHETEVRAIKTPGPVFNAAVSPNSRYVAASSYYLTVVYDFDTGKEVRRYTIKEPPRGPASFIWSLTFSPNSQLLATGMWDDVRVRLFDLEQGQEIWTTPFPDIGQAVFSLAFSHNRKFLLAGVSEDAPYLLDAETGVILKRYGEGVCGFKK